MLEIHNNINISFHDKQIDKRNILTEGHLILAFYPKYFSSSCSRNLYVH